MEDDFSDLDLGNLMSDSWSPDLSPIVQTDQYGNPVYAGELYTSPTTDNIASDSTMIDNNAVQTGLTAASSLTGDAKGILGALTGTSVAAPRNALPTTNQIGNLAKNLTASVSSFLPLIFIGLIIYLLFNIFRKHGR